MMRCNNVVQRVVSSVRLGVWSRNSNSRICCAASSYSTSAAVAPNVTTTPWFSIAARSRYHSYSTAASSASLLQQQQQQQQQRSLRAAATTIISSPFGSTTTSGEAADKASPVLTGMRVVLLDDGPDDNNSTRQYVLLPSSFPVEAIDGYREDPSTRKILLREKVATLYSNRNIIFGASRHDTNETTDTTHYTLTDLCGPLVDAAQTRCEEQGEQVQAMATLHGLCDWVVLCLDGAVHSPASDAIRDDEVVLGAVRAMATGVPRPGHSVVGQGTYRDGKEAWTALAREFADGAADANSEVGLYGSRGAETVAVEYLADTSEQYLRSAGGSMVRMYFV